jgi:hypothetical protein
MRTYLDRTLSFLSLNETVRTVYTAKNMDKITRCLTENAGVAN